MNDRYFSRLLYLSHHFLRTPFRGRIQEKPEDEGITRSASFGKKRMSEFNGLEVTRAWRVD